VRVLADDHVIMRSDYSLLCLDTSEYVTEGKSRAVRDYQNSAGTHHSHLQSRHDETKYM